MQLAIRLKALLKRLPFCTPRNFLSTFLAGKKFVVVMTSYNVVFFFSSRSRHTRCYRDWSSDVCSSDLAAITLWVACVHLIQFASAAIDHQDRKSVVEGKSVDLGGRRVIKNEKYITW